jgi:hypothetical protein
MYGTKAGLETPLSNTLRNFIQALPLKNPVGDNFSEIDKKVQYQDWLNQQAYDPHDRPSAQQQQLGLFKEAIWHYTAQGSGTLSNVTYHLVKDQVDQLGIFDPVSIKQAKMLVSAIREGPVIEEDLFRGVRLPRTQAQDLMNLKLGDTVEMPGIKSFSLDRWTADKFAAAYGEEIQSVLFVMKGAKRGLPVDVISSMMGEKEIITFGKFKVLGIEDTHPTKGAGNFYVDPKPQRVITIKQVGTH